MNQEKINAEAEAYDKYSPRAGYDVQDHFKAGISYAAANPDVIDCVKMATNSSQPTPEQQDVNQWTELAERVAEKVIPQFWHCPTEYKKEVITTITEAAQAGYERGLADSMVYAGLQQQLADQKQWSAALADKADDYRAELTELQHQLAEK